MASVHSVVVNGSSYDFEDRNSKMIADGYSPSKPYNVGVYAVQEGKLYRCKTKITSGEAWNPAHWDEVTAGAEITALNADMSETKPAVAENTADIADLKSALTSVLKEWLYAENATTGKYYGDANGTAYGSNTWAIFSTEIPIVAGRRYLYKKICPRFSWYRYTNSSGYLGDAVQSVNGYFDATEDGTIIVTTASEDISDAIFTEYQEIYDSGEQKDLTGIKTDETLSSSLLPANAKATGDALAKCYNTDETEFLVNDYYKNAQIVSGKFIGTNGVPSVSNSAKYAIVPVIGGDSYKLLMPGYTGGTQPGNIGVLVYAHSGSSDSFESFSEMTSGAYGDGQYFIFSVPAECNEIWFNVVLGSLDIEESAIVCKSIYDFSELDEMDGISELSGNKLVDDYARSKINASTDFRTSIYGLKIAVIGDSITEQTYWAKEGWFTKICNWANVIGQNLGESGNGFGQYEPKIALIASDVDMIGVASSFNDFQRIGTIGDITDTGVNTICGKANDFFDALITAFPNVPIICYCEGPWGNYHYGVSASDEYVEKIGIICSKHGIPYYDDLYTKGSALKPWITANTQEYFKCDDDSSEHYQEVNTVHPNSKGHVAIAHYLYGKFIENSMNNVANYYMGGA